jgi:hypothetical protein
MVTSRIWFTAKQKAELWERWKNGQSVLAIWARGACSSSKVVRYPLLLSKEPS